MPVGNTPNNIVKNSKLTGLILDTFYTGRHWSVSSPHHQGIHTKLCEKKKKWRLELMGALRIMGEAAPLMLPYWEEKQNSEQYGS